MSKTSNLLLTALFTLAITSTAAFADAGKGQKIYIKELKPVCRFDGGNLAKKHTQAEWKAVQDAGKLNEELQKQCPEAKPLKDNFVEHVYDFLYYYASDSGNVPAC